MKKKNLISLITFTLISSSFLISCDNNEQKSSELLEQNPEAIPHINNNDTEKYSGNNAYGVKNSNATEKGVGYTGSGVGSGNVIRQSLVSENQETSIQSFENEEEANTYLSVKTHEYKRELQKKLALVDEDLERLSNNITKQKTVSNYDIGTKPQGPAKVAINREIEKLKKSRKEIENHLSKLNSAMESDYQITRKLLNQEKDDFIMLAEKKLQKIDKNKNIVPKLKAKIQQLKTMKAGPEWEEVQNETVNLIKSVDNNFRKPELTDIYANNSEIGKSSVNN